MLPVPVSELDPAFIDVFYEFANTYSEESVRFAEMKRRKEKESAVNADLFRDLGYTEKEIAEMDVNG